MKVNDKASLGVLLESVYGMVPEYRFHQTRKYRFDWANPHTKIAVEYEGIGGGRHRVATQATGHSSVAGIDRDCEKYNLAQILGWRVLRITPMMLRDGRAATILSEALQEPIL